MIRTILLLLSFFISLDVSAALYLSSRSNFFKITVGQTSELNAIAIVASEDETFPDIQSIDWSLSFDAASFSIDVINIYGSGDFAITNEVLTIHQTLVEPVIDIDFLHLEIIPYLLFDFEVTPFETGQIKITIDSAIGMDSLGSTIDLLTEFGTGSDLVSNGINYNVEPTQDTPAKTVATLPLLAAILLAVATCGLVFYTNHSSKNLVL